MAVTVPAAKPFHSPQAMRAWQYREILAELGELQAHASDPNCPCTQADTGEYCLMKHSLRIHYLGRETASMVSPAEAVALNAMSEEALDLHTALKDRIVCGKEHKDEADAVEWSRQWRKKFEPVYYACTGGKAKMKQEAVLCQPMIPYVPMPDECLTASMSASVDPNTLGLRWSAPRLVNTQKGERMLRTASPGQTFWSEWRANKPGILAAGISVGKNPRTGDWEVAWWSTEGIAEKKAVETEKKAIEEVKKVEQVEASKATDADIEIPGLGGTLRPFQRAGVAYALKNKRTFIADEMGLGKTVQALATIQAAQAYPALIVVPASLKLNWEREAKTWVPGKTVQVLHGKSDIDPSKDLTILNYDILAKCADELSAVPFKTVVFDESHYLKNHEAKRTKEAMKLGQKAEYRLLLTGTPVLNRPCELLSQLQVIGKLEAMGGFWPFARRYCNAQKGRFGWDMSGATNLTELNEKLRATGTFIRREKATVLPELPAKTRVMIPMEIDNKREYQKAEQNLIAWLRETAGDEKARAARKAEELVKIEATKHLAAQGKLAAVKEWVESFLETGRKLVLFGQHRDIVDSLATAFNAPSITGETPTEKRQEAVDSFQTDPKVNLIVLNIQAGGVGLTLTAASDVAFIEQGWNPGTHDQAEDRVHRIGQKDSVTAYYFLGQGTIDERIAALIEAKRSVVSTTTEGKENLGVSVIQSLADSLLGVEGEREIEVPSPLKLTYSPMLLPASETGRLFPVAPPQAHRRFPPVSGHRIVVPPGGQPSMFPPQGRLFQAQMCQLVERILEEVVQEGKGKIRLVKRGRNWQIDRDYGKGEGYILLDNMGSVREDRAMRNWNRTLQIIGFNRARMCQIVPVREPDNPVQPQVKGIPVLPSTLADYQDNPESFIADLDRIAKPQGTADTIGLRGIYEKELGKKLLRPSFDSPEGLRGRRLAGTSTVHVSGTWAYDDDALKARGMRDAAQRVYDYGDQDYIAVVQGRNVPGELNNDVNEVVLANAHVIAYIRRSQTMPPPLPIPKKAPIAPDNTRRVLIGWTEDNKPIYEVREARAQQEAVLCQSVQPQVKVTGKCLTDSCSFKLKATGTHAEASTASAGALPGLIRDLAKQVTPAPAVKRTPETFAIGPTGITRYEFEYQIVPLDRLKVSHDPWTFQPNPVYAQALQPRLRDRAATQVQVLNIAKNLDPVPLLTEFHRLDTGAPIIGPDLIVESGNGRVMGMTRAAKEHPEVWAKYQAMLQEVAPTFGLKPPSGSDSILVRSRTTLNIDRVKFVQEANASSTIESSSVENARSDALKVTPEMLSNLEVRESQSIEDAVRAPGNRDFVRSFMAKLPANEVARLVDSKGELAQDGVRRVVLALFVSAFTGDAGLSLAERFFESTDLNVRNAFNGIAASLGPLARAEALIRSGQRQASYSISDDLAKAIGVFSSVKRTPGMTVEKYMSQASMIERELSPFQERVLSVLAEHSRSGKRIALILAGYANRVIDSPPPGQASMIALEPVSKEALFELAVKALEGQAVMAQSTSFPILPWPSDGALILRTLIERKGSQKLDPFEWTIHGDFILVAHAVTGREIGTIDLKDGSLLPSRSSDRSVLERVYGKILSIVELEKQRQTLERLMNFRFRNKTAIESILIAYPELAAKASAGPVRRSVEGTAAFIKKKLDKCNLSDDALAVAWDWRPLRDFIAYLIGLGKVSLCSVGMVEGTYQLRLATDKELDPAVFARMEKALGPRLRRVRSGDPHEHFWEVTVPGAEAPDLTWKPQEIITQRILEPVEQGRMFAPKWQREQELTDAQELASTILRLGGGIEQADIFQRVGAWLDASYDQKELKAKDAALLFRIVCDVDMTWRRFEIGKTLKDHLEASLKEARSSGVFREEGRYTRALLALSKLQSSDKECGRIGGSQVSMFRAEPLCRVVKTHDDGDQTVRCGKAEYVTTTEGKVYKASGDDRRCPHNSTELDAWIRSHPQKDSQGRTYLLSRYKALKRLCGESKADRIMRNLETCSWDFSSKVAMKSVCTPAQARKLERCILKVKAKGQDVNPFAVCTASVGCKRK